MVFATTICLSLRDCVLFVRVGNITKFGSKEMPLFFLSVLIYEMHFVYRNQQRRHCLSFVRSFACWWYLTKGKFSVSLRREAEQRISLNSRRSVRIKFRVSVGVVLKHIYILKPLHSVSSRWVEIKHWNGIYAKGKISSILKSHEDAQRTVSQSPWNNTKIKGKFPFAFQSEKVHLMSRNSDRNVQSNSVRAWMFGSAVWK